MNGIKRNYDLGGVYLNVSNHIIVIWSATNSKALIWFIDSFLRSKTLESHQCTDYGFYFKNLYCILYFMIHSRVHCSSDTNRSLGFRTKLMPIFPCMTLQCQESTQRRLSVNKRREFVSVMLRYYQHFLLATPQHKNLSTDLSN